jgi:recombination protein RecR
MALRNTEEAKELAKALHLLAATIVPCKRCGGLADVREASVCTICADTKRDATLLAVVARVPDMLAFEKSGAWRGRYFVLGQLVSPIEGTRIEDLPHASRRETIDDGVAEVLLALPSSVSGDTTGMFLARELRESGVKISMIARGVSYGGDLEFADAMTLARAVQGRVAP